MAAVSILCAALVVAFGGVSECNAQNLLEGNVADTVTFRIGFFAPRSNEVAALKVEESRKGFQYLVEEVNRRGSKIKWRSHAPTPFRFELIELSTAEELDDAMRSLHFLVGAEGLSSDAAEIEAQAAFGDNTVLVRCCSAENASRYDHNEQIFDVRPRSGSYVDWLLRSLILQPVGNLGVFWVEDDAFHTAACQNALEVFQSFWRIKDSVKDREILLKNDSWIPIEPEPGGRANNFVEEWVESVTQVVKSNKLEAVIACMPEDHGEMLVNAMDAHEYPVKAFFLTDGPGNPKWVERLGELAVDLLSATQLPDSDTLTDEFFGTGSKYIASMRTRFGENYTPTGTAAASSISAYLLALSAEEAFSECDPVQDSPIDLLDVMKSNSSMDCDGNKAWTGSKYIINHLLELDISTFIGEVTFGKDGRNKEDPFTIQVNNKNKTNIVLPVSEKPLRFPAKNRYKSICHEGDRFAGLDYFNPCEPCQAGYYSDTANAKSCSLCEIGFYGEREHMTGCDRCPEFTTTTIKGSTSVMDCQCEIGYFLPGNRTGEQCLPCPQGATCAGGLALPEPNAGYWSNEERLCSKCQAGHFKLGETCMSCLSKVYFVIMLFLLYLTWYILNMVISVSVASLDMLLSFAQLTNIIASVSLNWPTHIAATFGISNVLDFDLDFLWPSCLFSNWSFAHNLYVQLFFPLMMGLMALFQSAVVVNLCSNPVLQVCRYVIFVPLHREELSKKWDSTVAAFLAAIDVSYVTVTQYLFRVFRCDSIAGKTVLSASPDIVCGSQRHRVLLGASIIGILFYLVGYVVFVSMTLFRMHKDRAFAVPKNIRRYGFLYKQYEPGYVWMAVLVLGRRLAFVAALVFMNSPAFQAAGLAVLATASLMIHVYTAPYVDTYLDVLFSFLLVALMFETFGGLMFFSENLSPQDRQLTEWVVLATLTLVGLVFAVIFATELKRKYYMHLLKRMHVEAVLHGKHRDAEGSQRHSFNRKTKRSEVSAELFPTFHPEFLFRGLQGWEEGLLDWDRLTDKLQAYMSDGSETSYLSTKNIARFWRKLVAKFPELIDFLAIADDTTRGHFVEFAKGLYTDYFLKKRVDSLQIFKVLNWRDRAPLAQWLSLCPERDRQFFTVFMARLFYRARGENATDQLLQKLSASGPGWFRQRSFQSSISSVSPADHRSSIRTRGFGSPARKPFKKITPGNARWIMKSYGERSIRQEIQSGNGPLFHSATPSMNSIAENSDLNISGQMATSGSDPTTTASCEMMGLGMEKMDSDLTEKLGEGSEESPRSMGSELKPPEEPPTGDSSGRKPQLSISISELKESGYEEDDEGDTPTDTSARDRTTWHSVRPGGKQDGGHGSRKLQKQAFQEEIVVDMPKPSVSLPRENGKRVG
ncbi:hypothetical protein BSKO_04378 [Bryopsis sp. KO-2023]|nr:hypothetical protein BSKO_04378 [Bryopsis sp. KO-2023]